MEKQKKIALINDLSCVGRCSLSVAMPIISACGFESIPLPTGILSAHTEFDGYVCEDFTDKLTPFTEHWKNLGVRFDCICTGYLASLEQAEKIKRFLLDFKKSDTILIVDPVMGDNGRFYSRIDESFISEMRFLCSLADVILPNVTEAQMLCGDDFTEPPYSHSQISELLMKLSQTGAKRIVVTGIESESHPGQIGCAIYDAFGGNANLFFSPKTEGNFPGSGDVFAASFAASFMSGKSFADSVQIAMGFTGESVAKTELAGTERRYGLQFETQIPNLIKAVRKNATS